MTPAHRPLALVTGASSGIGLELAVQLAARDYDLVVCAEDRDLGAVVDGDSPRSTPGRRAAQRGSGSRRPAHRDADRGQPAPHRAQRDLGRLHRETAVAGHGRAPRGSGAGDGVDREPHARTLVCDVCRVPGLSALFAEAVRYELKDTGVTVTALIPGPVDTEFFDRAGMQGTVADEGSKDDPADVARDGIEAMLAGDDHVVPHSWRNKLQAA